MSLIFLTNNRPRSLFSLTAALFFLLTVVPVLRAEQVVRVGVYENSPKIYTEGGGRAAGFWPELINSIANREAWSIEYIPGTWSEGLRRLRNNEIDIMPDVAYTPKRAELYIFSSSRVLMSWAGLYVRRDEPTVLSLQSLSLKGKKIAALKGSTNLDGENGFREIASKLNLHCSFVEYNSYGEVFKAVADGVADAGITNRNFGNKNAVRYGLKKTPVIFNPTNIRFAFSKTSSLTPLLKTAIDRRMTLLEADESSIYYQLRQKYFEAGVTEKEGDIFPVWLISVLEFFGVTGIILLVTIIVSRRQIHRKTAELSSQKALLESITENVPGMVYQFYAKHNGEESGVRYTSSKLYDIFGLDFISDPPLLLQTFVENIHEEDRLNFVESVQRASKEQTAWNFKGRYVKPSGEIIWFEGLSSPVVQKDEIVFNGLLLDITRVKTLEEEYKRAEARLQRAQKMEAIGLMAGGVAHDLNNILSAIVGYPELILMDLPRDNPLRPQVETIRSAGLSAAAVVADLLTVARGSVAVKKPCNLNKLLHEYLDSPEIHHHLNTKSDIRLQTDLEAGLPIIKCSDTHICKCVLNLLINACEAIEQQGVVTISTDNRYIDTLLKGYDKVHKGEYVVLSVKDNGPGIAPQDIEHIFEPFYSKKVMGRSGTGLGLAVVWSAVQDHQGYIDLKTDEHGTCFELYFPACRDIPDEETMPDTGKLMGNDRKVLIIDDDEMQREIAASMLTKLKYRAEAVSGGEEAVAYIQKNEVDVLLLDMIMEPGINGRETYERIIAIRPGQKAVIATGFSQTDEVLRTQRLGAGEFINKPYTINQLGKALHDELKR